MRPTISALEIRKRLFPKRFRGFDAVEVTQFLETLSEDLEEMARELDELERENARLKEENTGHRNTEVTLKETLLLAQRSADSLREASEKDAGRIVGEAEPKAARMVQQSFVRMAVRHLAERATPEGASARAGAAQGAIRRVKDAALLAEGGRIVFAGPDADFVRLYGEVPAPGETVLDGRAKTAVPGFVDAHTHLPWDGFREDEFNRRLKGETYAAIAAAGGGILATVSTTRAASEETLARNVRARLDLMLRHGTTYCEAKTGYGLDLSNESKQLRALLAGAKGHAVGIAPTALPAHEVPPERRGSDALRRRYVDECRAEILPALADGGARFVDVFCEEGVFSVEESRAILEAGKAVGLRPRVHADELTPLGGASLAADVGALSADHLLYATDEGIEAMARSGVVATLLPGTSVFLRTNRYARSEEHTSELQS